MPRAIWSGAISFGLVNIPVKLYSAVSRKTVRFHQIDAESGQRIRQQQVNPGSGEEVPYEQIVKGYEISPDRYVTITPEELEALEPQKTRTIDIEQFVDLEQIDPIYDHRTTSRPTRAQPRRTSCCSTRWRRPTRSPSRAWSSARRRTSWRCAPTKRDHHGDDAVPRRGDPARLDRGAGRGGRRREDHQARSSTWRSS